MENWNDQNFWQSEKKQTESTNIKILGGPLHVLYCCCYNVTVGTWPLWPSRSVAVSALRVATAALLTDAMDRTIYRFRCKFFGRFRLSWLLFRPSSLCLNIDGTAIDVKTRLRCTAKHKLLSVLEFRRSNRHAEQGFQSTCVRSTCQAQTPHKFGSLGKRKSETLSLGMFPQPAAT